MRFVITGGHHNSALVVAQHLRYQGHQVFWFGRQYTNPKDTNYSAEYIEVTSNHFPFYTLPLGSANFPLIVLKSFYYLVRLKPQVIISFGSYFGASVALAGWFLRIPIFLHEQTVIAGKANLFTAHLAKRIFLTWPSSQKYYPPHKSQVVGLPLKPTLVNPYPYKKPSSLPVILILGGKLGSHVINQTIFALLPQLTKQYYLIHQTGTSSLTRDYQHALHLQKKLALTNYQVHGYITEPEISKYLHMADLVISRSGAHITYELAFLKKKAILIPFEHTSYQEQLVNARYLVNLRLGKIIREKDLTPHLLMTTITTYLNKPLVPLPLSLPSNAASLMIQSIFDYLQ